MLSIVHMRSIVIGMKKNAMGIRLPESLDLKIRKEAKVQFRTINNLIVLILEKHFEGQR